MSFEMEMRQAVKYAYNRRGQGDEATLRKEGLALAKAGRLDDDGNLRKDPAADPAAAERAMRMMDPTGFGGDPSLLEGDPDADVWTGRSGDVRDVYTDPRPALQRAIEAGQSTMSDLGPVGGGRAATATRGMEATFDAAMSPEFMAATILLPLAGGAVKMTRAAVLAKHPDLFAKAASLPAIRAASEAEIAAMRTHIAPKIQKGALLRRHGYGEWADVKAIEAGDLATLRAMQDKGINISAADIATARQQARWNRARPREDHLWRAGPTDAAKEASVLGKPRMSPAERAKADAYWENEQWWYPEAERGLHGPLPASSLATPSLGEGVMTPGIGMAMRGRAAPTFTTSPVPMQYGGITDPRLAKALAPPVGMALGAIKMFQEEQERMSDRDRTIDRQATFRSAQAAIKRTRAAGEELPTNLQVAEVDPERYYALTKMYGPAMGDNDIVDGTAEWVMAGNKARYAPAEDWYADAMSGTQSIEKRQLQPSQIRRQFPDPTTLDAVEAAPGPAKSFEELQREVEEEGRRLNPDEKLLREAAMKGGPMEGPMWTY